jgi:SAM-dependent methyltransferase
MEEEVPQAAPAASVAKWSGFYASGFAPWDAHRPASQLVAFLHDHPEGQRLLPPERSSTSAEVLEIGCGSGASCVWMAQQGMAVVGVDLVPLPLRAASAAATAVRAPAPKSNVEERAGREVTLAQAGVADRCRFVASDFMALPNSFSFAVGKRMSHEQQVLHSLCVEERNIT